MAVSFGICFWQNHLLLNLLNAPLAAQSKSQVREGHGPLGAVHTVAVSARDLGVQLRAVVGAIDARGTPPAVAASLARTRDAVDRDIARLSALPGTNQPVTLGIGEPFTTTVKCFASLVGRILALPVLWVRRTGSWSPRSRPATAGLHASCSPRFRHCF